MKELNRNTLKSAIAKLPNYAPADMVWAGIEWQLNTPQIEEIKTHFCGSCK